ncbi:MAG: hypothetical protein ACRC8Y_06100 [Chroococcales cyanobacterium]
MIIAVSPAIAINGVKTDNGLHPERPNAGDIAGMTEEYPSI